MGACAVKAVDQSAANFWKALDYLLRRRTHLPAFRRFRVRPRRPAVLPQLTPGLRRENVRQLIHQLVCARLLTRQEESGDWETALCALTVAGRQLQDILQHDLRKLDSLCRQSASAAGRTDSCGELRGGAWIIRKLLRQRGAMTVLARLPDEEFSCEQFVLRARLVPGAGANACLRLLTDCGLVERPRDLHWRSRSYQLSESGRQTQTLLAALQGLAGEDVRPIIGNPDFFINEAEVKTA